MKKEYKSTAQKRMMCRSIVNAYLLVNQESVLRKYVKKKRQQRNAQMRKCYVNLDFSYKDIAEIFECDIGVVKRTLKDSKQ